MSENYKSKPESFWLERLDDKSYRVLRKGGTERAFSGEYHNCKSEGTYVCRACGQPLFHSSAKYDSGTGWPSFYQPLDEDKVEYRDDRRLFSVRTEVACSRCGSHLGHVFDDGPPPTGKRYCMNSAALNLVSTSKS